MRIFKKSPNFGEIFQKSKLHLKDTDVASAHEKINKKSPIGSELEHVKQKKDIVTVHMIGQPQL